MHVYRWTSCRSLSSGGMRRNGSQAMVDAVLDPEGFKEGSHLHYILLDCCVTWMGWQQLFPLPPEGDAAPRLLDYLVRCRVLSQGS